MTTWTTAQLLTFAKLQSRVASRSYALPSGWAVTEDKKFFITGFHAMVFTGPAAMKVIAIEGVSLALRDLIGVGVRRLFGYDSRIAEWVRAHDPDLVTGHSGGGGIAAWLGWYLPVDTVVFNSGRTRQSLLNDGTRQTVVYITGDRWGDPVNGMYGSAMKGTQVELTPTGTELHKPTAIVAALDALE